MSRDKSVSPPEPLSRTESEEKILQEGSIIKSVTYTVRVDDDEDSESHDGRSMHKHQ